MAFINQWKSQTKEPKVIVIITTSSIYTCWRSQPLIFCCHIGLAQWMTPRATADFMNVWQKPQGIWLKREFKSTIRFCRLMKHLSQIFRAYTSLCEMIFFKLYAFKVFKGRQPCGIKTMVEKKKKGLCLTPPGLPSDAVTIRRYWSVVSLSRGFPSRRRPILQREGSGKTY